MRFSHIVVTVLLSAPCSAALSSNAADKPADEVRLSTMFDEDQADRVNLRMKKIDWATLLDKDEKRRLETKRMLAMGQVRTAHDFYCAALVFHHGQTGDDYRLATSMAWIAMTMEPANKDYAYLTASSWDRFMMEQGKSQWYGTKCLHKPGQRGKDELYPVDESAASDADRARFDLKPLQVMRDHTGESIRLSGADSTC
jgi:hypothetical protein